MARMYDCKYVYEMLPGIYAWPAKAAFRDHNVWGNELNTKQSLVLIRIQPTSGQLVLIYQLHLS
jgi:hypothetical protein